MSKVKPPTPKAFKPWAPRKHMRLAEINEAQPAVDTPKGTGNHNQYSEFMMSNGRTR